MCRVAFALLTTMASFTTCQANFLAQLVGGLQAATGDPLQQNFQEVNRFQRPPQLQE